MSRARAAGILLRQPRSTQALSQAIAIFAVGAADLPRHRHRLRRRTPRARRLFDEVVEQLEVGVTP